MKTKLSALEYSPTPNDIVEFEWILNFYKVLNKEVLLHIESELKKIVGGTLKKLAIIGSVPITLTKIGCLQCIYWQILRLIDEFFILKAAFWCSLFRQLELIQ